MANNGGRIFGIFDEVMGFFNMHGIYNIRTKVTECKEYRDLLRLYSCDDLRRETGKRIKILSELNLTLTINN